MQKFTIKEEVTIGKAVLEVGDMFEVLDEKVEVIEEKEKKEFSLKLFVDAEAPKKGGADAKVKLVFIDDNLSHTTATMPFQEATKLWTKISKSLTKSIEKAR